MDGWREWQNANVPISAILRCSKLHPSRVSGVLELTQKGKVGTSKRMTTKVSSREVSRKSQTPQDNKRCQFTLILGLPSRDIPYTTTAPFLGSHCSY